MSLDEAYKLVLADLSATEDATRNASDEAFARFDLSKDVTFERDGLRLLDEANELRTAHAVVLRLVKKREVVNG